MDQTEQINKGRQVSRAEKILEAKSAFLPGTHTRYKRGNQKTYVEGKKHSFGLFRMLVAGVLFLLLVCAFHFDVSYHGFNEGFVKERLADSSHWEKLVNQVSTVMKQIEK